MKTQPVPTNLCEDDMRSDIEVYEMSPKEKRCMKMHCEVSAHPVVRHTRELIQLRFFFGDETQREEMQVLLDAVSEAPAKGSVKLVAFSLVPRKEAGRSTERLVGAGAQIRKEEESLLLTVPFDACGIFCHEKGKTRRRRVRSEDLDEYSGKRRTVNRERSDMEKKKLSDEAELLIGRLKEESAEIRIEILHERIDGAEPVRMPRLALRSSAKADITIQEPFLFASLIFEDPAFRLKVQDTLKAAKKLKEKQDLFQICRFAALFSGEEGKGSTGLAFPVVSIVLPDKGEDVLLIAPALFAVCFTQKKNKPPRERNLWGRLLENAADQGGKRPAKTENAKAAGTESGSKDSEKGDADGERNEGCHENPAFDL